MTVLVIGAGFIGTPVVKRLVERDVDVVCLDHDPGEIPDLDGLVGVTADVTDRDTLHDVVDEYAPDTIVHLAYMLAAEMERQPTRAMAVNCVGVDNVFNVAAELGVDRVVFASSCAVYGEPNGAEETVTEDAVVPAAYTQYPTYLYAATKQLNEYQARNYDTHTDLDVVSVRPSLVFGPGRESGATKWSSTFVSEPARGESGHIPFPGDQRLGLVYYEDVARLFVELALSESVRHGAYNTGGHVVSVREAAALVEECFDEPVTWDEDGGALSLVADVSNERARQEFGFELTPLVEAVREHGARAE